MGRPKLDPEEARRRNAERAKKWREEHPDYMKKYMEGYRQEHLEEMRAADRRYTEEHREEKNAYRREWARKNPEKNEAAIQAWRAAHPEQIKDAYLQRKYGITLVQYNEMLVKQGGGCAICSSKIPGGRGRDYFHVDHDHKTNRVRGLLCHDCNTGLGKFKDSIELLQAAIEYLKRFQEPVVFPEDRAHEGGLGGFE